MPIRKDETVQQTGFVVNLSVEHRSTQNNEEEESGSQLPSLGRGQTRVFIRNAETVQVLYSTCKSG